MKIIVGKNAGFCYGVKNAVEKSKKELKQKENSEKVYCLGEIVHNKNVIKALEQDGMCFIDNLEENKDNGKTIIRAHGIPKEIYNKAVQKNIKLIDLTCPKVLMIHKIVSEFKEKNYYIFIIGSKKHPEIIGTASFCGEDNYSIIENSEDIDIAINNLKKSEKNNLAIVAQTTFSLQKFNDFTNIIKQKFNEIPEIENVEVKNTICYATKIRQEETEELSKKVDYMIIIGGKNSSNTKKLYEIAQRNCQNTICIENKDELDISKNNIDKNAKIGIMAGASTPMESIDKVVEYLK